MAAGEPLEEPSEGEEQAPGVTESAQGVSAGSEPEPPRFTRDDAELVMGLLVSGRGRDPADTWSAEERQAEKRLDLYRLGRIDGERTEPEPDGPGMGARRPYWLPEELWIGIEVGRLTTVAFTDQGTAERWAAAGKQETPIATGDRRRIFRLAVPVDTPTYAAETVPASTKLVEVPW